MGTTKVYESINLSFRFQMNKKERVKNKMNMNKKERVKCKFEMDFKKSVGFPI